MSSCHNHKHKQALHHHQLKFTKVHDRFTLLITTTNLWAIMPQKNLRLCSFESYVPILEIMWPETGICRYLKCKFNAPQNMEHDMRSQKGPKVKENIASILWWNMGTYISILWMLFFNTRIIPFRIIGGGVSFLAILSSLIKVELSSNIYMYLKMQIWWGNTLLCICLHLFMLHNHDICQILT